jgi:hypothetical protein
MSKSIFYFKTCCWLFMGLAMTLPIRADANSSMVFCEIADTCLILNKDDPNFDDVFENAVENTLLSTIQPTIINVIPRELPKGSTVNLTITAPNAHFNISSIDGVTIGGGVVVNSGGNVQPTEMVVNVTVPSDVSTGFYDVSITTELSDKTEVAVGTGVLQVIAPSGNPEILGITPSRVPKPLNNYALSVYGQDTNFSDASVIDFGDAGITVSDKTVNSPTSMTVFLNVSETAQDGLHNITVTTGAEVARNTQVGILRIIGEGVPPSIMAVEPWYGRQRNTLDVTVTGSGTSFSADSEVKFPEGSGIEVLSTTVNSQTQATANIKIADNATPSSYDVYVTTGAETLSFLKGFTVFSAATVTLDKTEAKQGEQITLQITGENTHFVQDTTEVNLGTGITLSSITVNNPTTLSAEVSIDEDAATTTRDVFVVTGGEVAMLVDAFTVHKKIPGEIQFSQENHNVNENAGSLTVTVQRLNGSDGEATVNYETSNGSATAGEDFETTSGTLTWNDGEGGNKTFTVNLLNDGEFESDETFTLTLKDITGASLDTATVTIVDDDPQPVDDDPQPVISNPGEIQFSQENYEVNENADSPIIVTVQRLNGSDGEVTVNYETSNGSATAGEDFETTSGTLTWKAEESNDIELPVTLIDDSQFEEQETFTITLSEVTGAILGSIKTATVIIADNDQSDQTDPQVTPPPSNNEPLDNSQPPVTGGNDQPPVTGENDQPPVTGENDQPPVTGGNDQPPVTGGNDQDILQPPVTKEPPPTDASNPEIEQPVTTTTSSHGLPSCSTRGEATSSCNAKGITITDLLVGENVTISNGILEGVIENKGWVSNFTVKPESTLTGGILTGQFINEGILADFEFRGGFITGGFLSGMIINNSKVGGYFKNVFLMPHTSIFNGNLRGNIEGDSEYPALLESLNVGKNSYLSHLLLGSNVKLGKNVTLGEGVIKMEKAIAINSTGEPVNTNALLIGGSFLNEGEFQPEITLSRFEKITIHARILVDPADVGETADILVCAAYKPFPKSKPRFYMIDSQNLIHLWDEEIANLVTLKEVDSLGRVQDVEILTGEFDFMGMLKLYFGYRLENGTIVYNLKTIDVIINN